MPSRTAGIIANPASGKDIRRLVDAMVLVTDDEMLAAVAYLETAEDILAEPAGAAATAALLVHDVAAGPTCAIVTGRNITDDLLQRARAMPVRDRPPQRA